MKTTVIGLFTAIAMLIGACATSGEMTPAQKDFIRDAAINRIEAFNRAGIQLVELSPLQILALDTACFTATAVALFATNEDGSAWVAPESVRDTCLVIMKIAAGDTTP